MPIVNKTVDKVGSVVSAIGNRIKSTWNSLKPSSGDVLTSKEHSGVDQGNARKGEILGGGNVDALIAPTLRTGPAKTALEKVAFVIEIATMLDSKPSTVQKGPNETVFKALEGGPLSNTVDVLGTAKDTTLHDGYTNSILIERPNGSDTTVKVLKPNVHN